MQDKDSAPPPVQDRPSTAEAAEFSNEQEFVDRAYANLDESRLRYRSAQREVEAQGAWGTPQARTERDAMAAHYGDQAARLESIEDRLVFGRLDSTEDRTIYIGRAGLGEPDGSRLLVDWRAPAARPFYQATAVEPLDVIRRRHIATHLRQVRGLEDEVLNTQAAQTSGLQLQGEGALISALSQAREGRMADIVSTIQAEQDAVIRAEDRGLLVVQGGPGTGKTAVALHRAAFLLYTHRERLERSGVLVIGPSPVFLRYIEKVLPSLGETGVVSVTLGDLVPGYRTSKMDPLDVAEAKGTLSWLPTLRAAVRDLQRLPETDQTIAMDGKRAVLSRRMVRAARASARRTGKPHNEARDVFASELVDGLASQLAGADPDSETLHWWREEVRASKDARREINLCWMPTRAEDLLGRLYANPDLLGRVGHSLTASERALVTRPRGSEITVSDIPLLDELEELLGDSPLLSKAPREQRPQLDQEEIDRAQQAIEGQQLGGGIISAETLAAQTLGQGDWKPLEERARGDRQWTYGHVVVDEAQDLSPMAWHSLLRRCPSQSFTVVGDLDQRRGLNRPQSWLDVLGPAARALNDERSLTISYRTPKTLTELAETVLAEVGAPVRFPLTSARSIPNTLADTVVDSPDQLQEAVREVTRKELDHLDREYEVGGGRIGILVSDARARQWNADRKGTSSFEQRVSLLSVVAAKGLEFDTTIIVEPEEILQDGPGDLFVAMTRSTQRLHSVRSEALPPSWCAALTEERDG